MSAKACPVCGEHSRDASRESLIDVEADAPAVALVADSTLAEWVRHPLGSVLLAERAPGFVALAEDPDAGEMMGAMPMSRLVRFPGMPLDEDAYTALLAEVEAR